MTKPTGFVIYEGPSLLTGEPIVAICTLESSNDKTGNMLQVWYLRQDIDPITANRMGADRAICGNCPKMGIPQPDKDTGLAAERECYVDLGRAPMGIYGCYRRGGYPRAFGHAEIARIGRGREVRFGAYGDPAAVPKYINDSLASESAGWTAYSHQSNWEGSGFDGARMMVSADTLEAARAAWAQGHRTYRVVGTVAEIDRKHESLCPGSDEYRAMTGKHVHCIDCMLCHGDDPVAKSIAIPTHGAGRKHHKTAA